VHTFGNRDAPGVRIEETWDALGVRATAGHDTVFEQALAEAHKTVARHPVGPIYPDYIGVLLGWYLPLLSSVYFGIARRALDLAILGAQTRNSLREGISRHAQKPAVSRYWRDARTLTLHDATRWKLQHIGRYTLSGTRPPRHGQV
jgi:alkylation response protein AidB-like acyl-CoA dehydrogenase